MYIYVKLTESSAPWTCSAAESKYDAAYKHINVCIYLCANM